MKEYKLRSTMDEYYIPHSYAVPVDSLEEFRKWDDANSMYRQYRVTNPRTLPVGCVEINVKDFVFSLP